VIVAAGHDRGRPGGFTHRTHSRLQNREFKQTPADLFLGPEPNGLMRHWRHKRGNHDRAYIVQADEPGRTAASVTVAGREEAFAIARNWVKSGQTGVKVIGDGCGLLGHGRAIAL
jgi:hypothetical protein